MVVWEEVVCVEGWGIGLGREGMLEGGPSVGL
jgi:hypothetical protein